MQNTQWVSYKQTIISTTTVTMKKMNTMSTNNILVPIADNNNNNNVAHPTKEAHKAVATTTAGSTVDTLLLQPTMNVGLLGR